MAAIAVRLLRIVSILICLIVTASFVVFAVQQTKGASNQQTEQLSNEGSGASSSTAKSPAHESSAHKALDEASNEFTSPFEGIVSESESEWASHGVKLLLALLLYGFAVGYLLRILSIRV